MRAVIFDRDDTLLFFDQPAMLRLDAEVCALASGAPAGAAAELWAGWAGPWPRTEAEEPTFWRAFWRAFAERHGVPEARVADLCAIGPRYTTCFGAFPDAAPCLRALHAQGLRLAVLTNYELPSVAETLRAAGLAPELFSALLTSAAIGAYKPDPRAFLAAAETLGVAPGDCAFVDDLPEHVAGACAVGMRGVLLDRRGRHPHGAAREVVSSLGQLGALLR